MFWVWLTVLEWVFLLFYKNIYLTFWVFLPFICEISAHVSIKAVFQKQLKIIPSKRWDNIYVSTVVT